MERNEIMKNILPQKYFITAVSITLIICIIIVYIGFIFNELFITFLFAIIFFILSFISNYYSYVEDPYYIELSNERLYLKFKKGEKIIKWNEINNIKDSICQRRSKFPQLWHLKIPHLYI